MPPPCSSIHQVAQDSTHARAHARAHTHTHTHTHTHAHTVTHTPAGLVSQCSLAAGCSMLRGSLHLPSPTPPTCVRVHSRCRLFQDVRGTRGEGARRVARMQACTGRTDVPDAPPRKCVHRIVTNLQHAKCGAVNSYCAKNRSSLKAGSSSCGPADCDGSAILPCNLRCAQWPSFTRLLGPPPSPGPPSLSHTHTRQPPHTHHHHHHHHQKQHPQITAKPTRVFKKKAPAFQAAHHPPPATTSTAYGKTHPRAVTSTHIHARTHAATHSRASNSKGVHQASMSCWHTSSRPFSPSHLGPTTSTSHN